MENNIIPLNVFPNNTITNFISKQDKILGPTFFKKNYLSASKLFDLKPLK